MYHSIKYKNFFGQKTQADELLKYIFKLPVDQSLRRQLLLKKKNVTQE